MPPPPPLPPPHLVTVLLSLHHVVHPQLRSRAMPPEYQVLGCAVVCVVCDEVRHGGEHTIRPHIAARPVRKHVDRVMDDLVAAVCVCVCVCV